LERLELTGTAGTGVGNEAGNTIVGNAANNLLDGLGGDDLLVGGAGNDIYFIATGDRVLEEVNGGIDTINSDGNYSLGANQENLTLLGTDNFFGTGNALDNTIIGNEGSNDLDGRGGIDRLEGGLGDDTYTVDNASDVIVEEDGAGNDTVRSTITYTLSANLENLTLLGRANINGVGNDGNNTIIGNDGINRLDGGLGDDNMAGGRGNDTYIVDSDGDVVTEAVNAGIDTVGAESPIASVTTWKTSTSKAKKRSTAQVTTSATRSSATTTTTS
ncbi:MAG: calcium-binding protein, partial [Leptolyngbyaceae cyanobacterium SM1_3_5]|nr:calcium-binding protein [Leptolyngbyaceae cyanobacterium SM1_3_5]